MQIGSWTYRTVLLIVLLGSLLASSQVSQAQSQLDPALWQQTANGLSVTHNDHQETGGLGMVVGAEGWPAMKLRGGVDDTDWNAITGPVGIDLGRIRIPGSITPTLSSEDTNWARNALMFDADPSLSVWVSRLSPAIAIESTSAVLRLFGGPVHGNLYDGSRVQDRPESPSYPKYVAYVADGSVRVQPLTADSLSLETLSANWLLLWYGASSHFVDTKTPTTYSGWGALSSSLSHSEAYQADAPLLLVFETRPETIQHGPNGGVELAFEGAAGLLTVQPLLGRDHPEASETEAWSGGLPESVLDRVRWWHSHLCRFPVDVLETYAYEASSDTAIFTETFEYLTLCSGGITFAPIPPMLALSHEALSVVFSGAVVDAQLNTEYGPTLGIENTSSYTWRVSRLGNYADARRVVSGDGAVPAELEQALSSEVASLLSVGHLAPWVFSDSVPQYPVRGDIYWQNPGEILYHLVEVGEALAGAQRSQLEVYLQSEQLDFPAETVASLPLGEGTERAALSVSDSRVYEEWQRQHPWLFSEKVSLFSFYGLSRYHDFLTLAPSAEVLAAAIDTLDRHMQEQDWATYYWFGGFDEERIAVINANRQLAGLIGLVRLTERTDDSELKALARCLFAKAVILRLGLARYPRYLYEADVTELPPAAAWQVIYTAGGWRGFIFNYDWNEASDDARQVVLLDQHGVMLYDHSGFGPWAGGICSAYLVAYRDLVPEVARLLDQLAEQDVEVYLDKAQKLFPHWYAAFREAMLGVEHNMSHPGDSYQLFIAEAWLREPTPEQLARYVDVPWLQTGDLFYMQKLAEVVRSYRGSMWTNTVALYGMAGSSAIELEWSVYVDVASGLTWRIIYEGRPGDQPAFIEDLPSELRHYTLTGLSNFVPYTVRVEGIRDGSVVLSSNPITARPRGETYLPLVFRHLGP